MAQQSISLPLAVNISTSSPNEKVKEFDSVSTFKQSALSGNPGIPAFEHTRNNGIHAEDGVTTTYKLRSNAISGRYNYIATNGQRLSLEDNGTDPVSGVPVRALRINGKFIDNVPSYGVQNLQALPSGYNDFIQTDGNPIGMKVLKNAPGVVQNATGGTSWNGVVAPPIMSPFSDIAYGNGIYVAVFTKGIFIGPGPNSYIAYSYDGISWTPVSFISASHAGLTSIAFGLGTFVVTALHGGASNSIFTSTDGMNWSTRTLPSTPDGNGLIDVVFGNGLFVAVSSGASTTNCVYTSPDGITWTAQTLPAVPSAALIAIAYQSTGTVFCIIAHNSAASNTVFTSTNGSAWIARTIPATPASSLWDITSSGSLFVVATQATLSTPGSIMTSADGTTWTLRSPSAPGSAGLTSITFAGTLFFVSTSSAAGGTSLYSSPDGITWTAVPIPSSAFPTLFRAAIVSSPNGVLFIANGNSFSRGTNAIRSSDFGSTFSLISISNVASIQRTRSVAFGNGVFVAYSSGIKTGGAYISSDGITWTECSFPRDASPLLTGSGFITFLNGKFYISTGSTGGTDQLISSPDGINWSFISIPGFIRAMTSLTYGAGKFVATFNGNSQTQSVATSLDGVNWSYQVLPTAPIGNVSSSAFGAGVFVIVVFNNATTNTIYTSPDGITWTPRTRPAAVPSDSGIVSIIYAPGSISLFVACTSGTDVGNIVLTSPDGTTWTYRTMPGVTGGFNRMVYGNGVVLVLSGNQVIRSTDGITWSNVLTLAATSALLVSSSFGNGLFVTINIGSGAGATGGATDGTFSYISNATLSTVSQLSVQLDEINSQGSVVNTITYNIDNAGFGAPLCLVRQCLTNSFTWASQQYLLCRVSLSSYAIIDMTGALISTTISSAWGGPAPFNLYAAKFVGATTFIVCSLGGNQALNPSAIVTASTVSPMSYSWVIMQSKSAFNRFILTGEKPAQGKNGQFITVLGYTAFTNASLKTAPIFNSCDNSPSESFLTSSYCYVDAVRASGSRYISSHANPGSPSGDVDSLGLMESYFLSTGMAKGVGRLSWVDNTTFGAQNPFEFRVMMAPLYASTSSSNGNQALSAQPVGLSVGMCYDATQTGQIPMGVPLTALGEFDPLFSPQLGPAMDSIMWRFNNNYFIVTISTSPSNPIQKITDRLYKINTISPLNIVDIDLGKLSLGSNDYTGGAITSGGSTNGAINLMVYGQFANSIDYGLTINPGTDAPNVTPLAALQPSCHSFQSYWDIVKYSVTTGAISGLTIYDSVGDAFNSSSFTASALNAINQNPAYVQNPVIPIPMGAIYSGYSTSKNASANSVPFNETYFLGGFPMGGAVESPDYDGYLIGNVVPKAMTAFVLFGVTYLYDGEFIYLADVVSNALALPLTKVVRADGLMFLAFDQSVAYFVSRFDNSLFGFDGGRVLNKIRKMNSFPAVTQAVYSVRDNTMLMDAGTSWLWIRDGLITSIDKDADQLGVSIAFHYTVDGIYLAIDNPALDGGSVFWQYGFDPSQMSMPSGIASTLTVVPLDLQVAFYGLGANRISRETVWIVAVWSKAKAASSVTATVYSFDQDENKGIVNGNPQKTVVNIRPGDYDDGGYFRFSVMPQKSKALASSLRLQCLDKMTVAEVMVQYDDQISPAIFAPDRRGR